MDHRVGPRRRRVRPRGSARRDHLGHRRDAHRLCQVQHLAHPMGAGHGLDRLAQRETLHAACRVVSLDQADAAAPRRPGKQSRPVAALGGECKVVAAPHLAYESKRLDRRWPGRHRDDASDIRIAGKNSLRAGEHQHVDRGTRIGALQAADQRRRKQHIAEPAQRDDENARWNSHRHGAPDVAPTEDEAARRLSAMPPTTPKPNT